VSLSGGVLNEKPEEWDSVIETQLNAVFLLSKLAAKSMVTRKSGKIINIGSMDNRRKLPEQPCTWPRGLRTSSPVLPFVSTAVMRSGNTLNLTNARKTIHLK
jgi:NAD(P)-dependent dehydrogenase (short-subunit alcohol dehydrogenase family)